DVPEFLDPDAIVLRADVGIELEAADQLLAAVPAATFGEPAVPGAQLHARRVHAFLGSAFAIDAEIAGQDALDHAFFIDECFLGGEARVDFHAQVLCLLRQPAA